MDNSRLPEALERDIADNLDLDLSTDAAQRQAVAAEQNAATIQAALSLYDRQVVAHERIAAALTRLSMLAPKCSDERDARLLPFFVAALEAKPALPEKMRFEQRVGLLAENLAAAFDYWTADAAGREKIKAAAAADKAARDSAKASEQAVC